jgi:iron complex transport system ATP-binding protein
MSDRERIGIAARGLVCGYRGRRVIDGLDLRVQAGELLALVGPNGAGKTTLFRALSGELPLEAGEALVESARGSIPVAKLSDRERAARIGRVLQGERPAWPASAREYAASGRFAAVGWFSSESPAGRDSVDQALETVGAAALAERPVTELSGGEFKRILIARALVQGAGILLLDEPVAELDVAGQMAVLDLLRHIAASGGAVAFSVHDLNLAALAADKVAVLANGKLAAYGPPREALSSELIAAVYGSSVHVGEHPVADSLQISPLPPWLGRPSR